MVGYGSGPYGSGPYGEGSSVGRDPSIKKLQWDLLKDKFFDAGVDRGVLYLDDGALPWNGLVNVEEKEAGALNVEHYFDGTRLHISQETGTFEATVSAYTYPEPFSEYNGYSKRETYKRFGFSYRTQYADRYRIHLVYNALVRDDSRTWVTESNNSNPSTFNWDIYASDVPIPGASPSSRLILESPRDDTVLSDLEDILYGTDTTKARLPTPSEIVELYESRTTLRITYNGNGTYTAEGPDDVVRLLSGGRFQINSPSVALVGGGRFVVDSY